MADTMGHSATANRNTSVVISFCLLAIAPQIFEFIWSFGTIFGWGAGRGPAAVVISHATALLAGAPGALLGAVGGDTKKASSDVLLALIYSYPIFAVAILTFFMTIRSAQDYVGGIVLMALALFALWASSDLQGMRGFSFGAGTAPRMFGGLLVALGAGIALTGLLTDGPAHGALCLAWAALRDGLDRLLRVGDSSAWGGGDGVRKLHDRGDGHA